MRYIWIIRYTWNLSRDWTWIFSRERYGEVDILYMDLTGERYRAFHDILGLLATHGVYQIQKQNSTRYTYGLLDIHGIFTRDRHGAFQEKGIEQQL